jgi:hypothetical protein
MVIFRKGGKVQNKDSICYNLEMIKIVISCEYLGIMLQTAGMVFNLHVEEKT